MRKMFLLILIFGSLFIITGCDSKSSNQIEKNEESTIIETNYDIDDVNTTSVIESTEVIKTSTTSTEKSTSKKTTKETTTSKACQEKKFSKNYSYVYETLDDCKHKGNDAFFEVSDNVNDQVATFECKEIVDECGKTWYGVVFNAWSDTESKYVEFYY